MRRCDTSREKVSRLVPAVSRFIWHNRSPERLALHGYRRFVPVVPVVPVDFKGVGMRFHGSCTLQENHIEALAILDTGELRCPKFQGAATLGQVVVFVVGRHQSPKRMIQASLSD